MHRWSCWNILLVVFCTASPLLAQSFDMTSLALIPAPAHLEMRTGHFEFGREIFICAGPEAAAEAWLLGERLRQRTGLRVWTVTEVPQTSHLRLELDSTLASELGEEGYRLRITPTAVELRAATAAGLFYAGAIACSTIGISSSRVAWTRRRSSSRNRWNGSAMKSLHTPRQERAHLIPLMIDEECRPIR